MNKKIKNIVLIILFSIIIIFLLNINVTTHYGRNYIVYEKQIPLYLKITSFIDRHFQYSELVRKITKGCSNKQEKVMVILRWVKKNIKYQPKNLPVLDDHVWYTIVRGYGVPDQFSDVFATLCNYSGVNAWFDVIYSKDQKSKIPLSFVKIHDRLHIFDPFNGVFFENNNGELADITEIKNGNWIPKYIKGSKNKTFDYTNYFENMHDIEEASLTRAQIQSPLRRIQFELKRLIK